MAETILAFPEGFLWGTATAAHQVEGGNTNNDWYLWEQRPGRIRNGDRAGTACDWWHRAEEDFDRARELGQNSHRLSLEWSRLEPRPGEWDTAAFARYRQMLAGLRQRHLEPMVTLYHFTLPIWVAEQGGWLNPQTIGHFVRYVERVMQELGDLVTLWCTINEPVVYVYMGYLQGIWPPGMQSFPLALKALRHLLLAHAEAYRLIHSLRGHVQVGLVKNMMYIEPWRADSWLDRQWAGQLDRLYNELPLLAVTEGRFRPPLGWGMVPKLVDSLDFLGVNYYSRYFFGVDRRNWLQSFTPRLNPRGIISDYNYGEVFPEGLYRVLKRVQSYGKPIYITENGLPDEDDDLRPYFILTHLAQVWRAVQDGVPVRGYYHWSLVDNFEWVEGYRMRFGLIEVDLGTQERRVRRSGRLYAEICQANAITPESVQRYAPEAVEMIFGPAAPTLLEGVR
ncbi:MAG: glycoside hydrolase family 1 protein [Anaerolineae bacterium]